MESRLASLSREHPQDIFRSDYCHALCAQGKMIRTKAQAALKRLAQLVSATRWKDVPAGKRANSRQRAEAAPQIGLWLVARECLASLKHRDVAESLASRAIAAARNSSSRPN